ncbi:NAD(P)/FAD-dependent oxidoreductase [Methylobacterium frigidaeris]|uniref:Glycine oxidase n=1 Tax=Methylobacterium frigidaeris TaxID=2038277 RepID=A0AA37M302_9HYPH|nr:FAD-binding oxidoreductase [Methylobacterium frigidaeris]PIK69627.1 amino acid dehydrogenase [Methylobacterium frigidaeris]GJD60805.1 Glycine oxidase [Methylobacterium frigidaeris]
MRSAIVLGAGMVGIGTALHLQQRGWSVALVDRGGPGRETSYGNAGIIQSEAVEPYAMPRDRAALWAIATGRSNDVHYELRSLHRHLGPLLRYWWHSGPRRHAVASHAYAGLIGHAVPEHAALIEAAGAADLVRRDGFRVLHRDRRAMDEAVAEAERLRARYGVRARALSSADLAAAEPVLKRTGAGAIHWEDPWSVRDPGALVASYAALFARRGGTLLRGEADSLAPAGRGWSVRTTDGTVEAAAAVVALGPWSPALLRRFGYRIAMVRKRGYHRHWRNARTLDLPLYDAQNGTVLAPMAAGLRITTGAELAGPDAATGPVQLARAEAAAAGLLDLGGPRENAPWSGIRPCMPDMLPVVGPAPRHPGLWFHFGHGHQGFTLGPASGRLLAEAMSGEAPLVPPAPFRPGRR